MRKYAEQALEYAIALIPGDAEIISVQAEQREEGRKVRVYFTRLNCLHYVLDALVAPEGCHYQLHSIPERGTLDGFQTVL